MFRYVAAIALGLAAVSPATAQQSFCGLRDDIVRALHEKYGEERRGAGLQNAQTIIEIFASEKTGTWTLVVSRTDGSACAVAAGEAWRDDPGPLAADDRI